MFAVLNTNESIWTLDQYERNKERLNRLYILFPIQDGFQMNNKWLKSIQML